MTIGPENQGGAQDVPALPAERPVDHPNAIPALRERIDDLDAQIARLVLSRAEFSRRIQAARMSDGGTRVELNREGQVVGHYRTTLGPDGPMLASAILSICRGRLTQ